MTKSESKYFRTAQLMDEAFLRLLETKDYDYITVKELCEKAGVNRSTFYLHYENMNDLLEESIQFMMSKFLSCFSQENRDVIKRIEGSAADDLYLIRDQYLRPYLSYVSENRRLFKTAMEKKSLLQLENSFSRMFQHLLNPIMEKFRIPEEERIYMCHYYLNGITAIVMEWLRNDCDKSQEWIMQLIVKCVGRRFRTGRHV